MIDSADKGDDGFGAEFRRRMSPELARRERRRALWAGVLCLGMGSTLLLLGVNSVRTGEWVELGRVGSSYELPGFVVVGMALFLLYTSGWMMRRFGRKT
jgi:hypothetical protein